MKSCQYCNGTGKVERYQSGKYVVQYCEYCYGDGVAGGGVNDVLIVLATSILFVICSVIGGFISGIITWR